MTLVHRGAEMGKSLKYWVKPDIENRIRAGEIRALFHTQVTRIEPHRVWIKNSGAETSIQAEQVFALTGYHPDFSFLERQGIGLDPETSGPRRTLKLSKPIVPVFTWLAWWSAVKILPTSSSKTDAFTDAKSPPRSPGRARCKSAAGRPARRMTMRSLRLVTGFRSSIHEAVCLRYRTLLQ